MNYGERVMTTKYPMPEPRSHHELRIAHSMGATIEGRESNQCGWSERNYGVFGLTRIEIRIKPDCQYALAKIAELGGDEMADVYKAWLDGAEVEDNEVLFRLSEDPFNRFMYYLNEVPNAKHHLHLKKKKVKRKDHWPKWAKYKVIDPLGRKWFYANEPGIYNGSDWWSCRGFIEYHKTKKNYKDDWTKSLRKIED